MRFAEIKTPIKVQSQFSFTATMRENTLIIEILGIYMILRSAICWKEMSDDDCAEIWNGEHLQDVLCNKENVVTKNSLLITYGPQCKSIAEEMWTGLLKAPLPSSQYLTLLRHDHMSAPNNTWFDYGNTYDLTYRLHITNCLEIYYLKEGTTLDHYMKYPSSDYRGLVTWIWDHLQINVSVWNDMEKPLHVMLEGYIPNEKDNYPLEANKVISLATYMSNLIILYSTVEEEFLDGYEVISSTLIKATDKSRYKGKEEMWRIRSHLEQRENEESFKLFLCSHQKRHFNILTQPQSVPSFTEKGYLLTKTPPHVHEMLLKIFEDNKFQLSQEYYPDHFTVWNLDEISIKQVTISEGKTLYLSEELQPILENWCNCALHPTKGDGIVTRIRMYPKGSKVRMHVDEVESGHVIGAILQVAQDPNMSGKDRWPLEVIDFHGQRKEIFMNPGDMVLFESSKLVHGRPRTLPGDYYVNSFFYYTPNTGWNVLPRDGLRDTTISEFTDETGTISATTDLLKHKDSKRPFGRADEL